MHPKSLIKGALAALLAVSGPAVRADRAPDDQAFLGIFAETSAMKMAGMPAPKLPPGFKLPEGVKLPPQAAAALKAMSGQAQRKLTVRLWSPGLAPDSATASLGIPEGLKLGPKLDLDLYRPKPGAVEGADVPAGPGAPNFDELTIKRYWGSSATVRPGQPEVIEFKGLTAEQKAAMKSQAARARQTAAGSYFYKPDWTTGYWPSEKQPGEIADDAVLTGHYALTTSYTGSVEMDVPATVNFLAPIEMSSPNLEEPIKFPDAITFSWKAIPNALGYHASIIGMQQDKKTIIMWSSSESKPEMGMMMDYLQMAEVRDLVSRDIVMKGDRVEVTVPAGIFNDCDFVMFQMIGWGPGAAIDKGQPLPRLQTKTTLNIMLGGKKLPRGRFGNGE
jgi:hypothetical protein